MADVGNKKAENKVRLPMTYIIGILVIGLLLAGGVSYFIASKMLAEKSGEKGAPAQHEPGVFMKLGDAKDGLVINVGGPNSGRYLKIGIILELKPDKNLAAKEGKTLSPEEIKILDTVVHVLRSQKVENFDPSKQPQLKELIKNEVNRVLGQEKVYEVYITNLVLQ